MLYVEESAVVSDCYNGNGMLYVLRVSFRCTLRFFVQLWERFVYYLTLWWQP